MDEVYLLPTMQFQPDLDIMDPETLLSLAYSIDLKIMNTRFRESVVLMHSAVLQLSVTNVLCC